MSEHNPHDPLTVHFTVRDMKRTIDFYRGTLGFQLDTCWPDEAHPMWASLRMDRQTLMFGANMSPDDASQMCGGDEAAASHMRTMAEEFAKNQPGVGIVTYVAVPDVDKYHADVTKKLKNLPTPKTQFYGLRDFPVQDPDGYRFQFYSLVKLSSCQSCGMPLADAQPGQMYCNYCVDEKGKLKSYETVLEGCINGYFIPHHKMQRPEAEKAAKEHLAKMPAWAGRG